MKLKRILNELSARAEVMYNYDDRFDEPGVSVQINHPEAGGNGHFMLTYDQSLNFLNGLLIMTTTATKSKSFNDIKFRRIKQDEIELIEIQATRYFNLANHQLFTTDECKMLISPLKKLLKKRPDKWD